MKNLIAAAMVFVFVSCSIDKVIPVRGNGDLISSERTVSSFKKINSAGNAKVNFYESQEYRVVVTTDSNLIEVVTTETRNNTLNIGTEIGNYSFTKLVVDVYCPVLTGVSISGSGDFYGNDKITVSAFESDVSGSGKIEGIIECEKFTGKISGSGRIIVSGKGDDSSIDIAGSGNFSGNDFIMSTADIRISGSGNAKVYVTDNLKVNVSGSGEISYSGSPTVNSNITGSGRVKKL